MNNLFDVSVCNGICEGTCVIVQEGAIVFAGPIRLAPDVSETLVLMHEKDFQRLQDHKAKHWH